MVVMKDRAVVSQNVLKTEKKNTNVIFHVVGVLLKCCVPLIMLEKVSFQ